MQRCSVYKLILFYNMYWILVYVLQECIPVGCVPPAYWPTLGGGPSRHNTPFMDFPFHGTPLRMTPPAKDRTPLPKDGTLSSCNRMTDKMYKKVEKLQTLHRRDYYCNSIVVFTTNWKFWCCCIHCLFSVNECQWLVYTHTFPFIPTWYHSKYMYHISADSMYKSWIQDW